MGRGFGGFLDLCEKIILLLKKMPGGVIPPAGRVFFREFNKIPKKRKSQTHNIIKK